jgi:hypothetical protein
MPSLVVQYLSFHAYIQYILFNTLFHLYRLSNAVCGSNAILAPQVPVVKLRKSESDVHDASGMSGGERSYTTLALLMSLTNSIDSPFTCMDEFDVFMDEKNRRTSVSVMLKVAKELKKRQFLFITPNSIPVDDRDLVQNGGPVVIRKLVKPVRTEGGM